jgi:hypothetical protein
LGFLKDAADENSGKNEKLHEDDRYDDKGEGGEEQNGNLDNEDSGDDDNDISGDMPQVLLVGKKNMHNTVQESGAGKNENKEIHKLHKIGRLPNHIGICELL